MAQPVKSVFRLCLSKVLFINILVHPTSNSIDMADTIVELQVLDLRSQTPCIPNPKLAFQTPCGFDHW